MVTYMNSNLVTNENNSRDMNELNNNSKKREKILSEIAKKNGIRKIKPEYEVTLDILQTISPCTIKELEEEINDAYGCKMFTYKQLYDVVQSLTHFGVIKNNFITKQITINPEYISRPDTLPISSYFITIFGISGMVLVILLTTGIKIDISLTTTAFIIFCVVGLCLLAQGFGSKFEFKGSR